jgi:Domain of unknown function (DUF4190)
MTDQGSVPDQPGDEERAPGADPEGPSPFSRESSAAGAHSVDPADPRPPSTGEPGPAPVDPYGYPPAPGAGAAGPDYPTFGPSGPGAFDSPGQAYGQNQYPSARPEPDPSQPYGHPGAQPYVPPGSNPWAEPTPPSYDPQAGAYGQPYIPPGPGQGYEVSPYQASYGGYAAYGATPLQHPQAVAALVTGLLGVLTCPFVGVAGIVLGTKVRREIDSDPQRYTGRGMATAGLVLGVVGTVLTALLLLGIIGLVAVAQ